MHRIDVVVRGKVQGVGFRYWAHHTAHAMPGLAGGAVRNLPDGSVAVVAESSDRGVLQALVDALHRGPGAAQVVAVEVEWSEAGSGSFDSFRIDPD